MSDTTQTNELTQTLVANINDLTQWIKVTAAPAVGDAAKTVEHFAAEQTPLYIKEYVGWIFWQNALTALWGVILLIGMLVALKWFIINFKKSCEAKQQSKGLGYVFACVLLGFTIYGTGLGGIITVTTAVPLAVKAIVAPRVIIVENLNNIIHGK